MSSSELYVLVAYCDAASARILQDEVGIGKRALATWDIG